MRVTSKKYPFFLLFTHKHLLVLVAFALSFTAHAQWENVFQPSQFEVRSVFTYKKEVIVGTQRRELFFSDDEGKNWRKLFLNLPNQEQSIENLVATEKVIMVGIPGFGIRRSFDKGQTWNWANSGLKNLTVTSLVTIEERIFAATRNGIFISINEGNTWHAVNTGLSSMNVITLATHNSDLFAGTDGGELFQYNADNDIWEKLEIPNLQVNIKTITFQGNDIFLGTSGQGVICILGKDRQVKAVNTGLLTSYIHDLAANNSRIFAATDAGLFITEDKGLHWKPQYESSDFNFETVYSVETQEEKVITGIGQQGISLSKDGGQSWLNVATISTTASIKNLLSTENGLYVSTRKRLFFSQDGLHFQYRTSVEATITGIAQLKQYLFLGTKKGILRSADRGFSWKAMSVQAPVSHLVVHQNQLMVVTERGEIMVSQDAGSQWELIAQFPSYNAITALAVKGNHCWIGTSNGIFCFTKVNNIWKYSCKTLNARAITTLVVQKNKIFAAIKYLSEYSLLQSDDAGKTWTPALEDASEYPINIMVSTPAYLIVKDNSGQLTIFLEDKRNSSIMKAGEKPVNNISTLTVFNGYLLAGTTNAGIWSFNLENLSFPPSVSVLDPEIFTIYPNPANSIINFKVNQKDLPDIQFYLRDEQGKIQQCYEGNLSDSTFQWDISSQSSGTYFLEMVKGDHKVVKRIIKK